MAKADGSCFNEIIRIEKLIREDQVQIKYYKT